MYQSLATPGNTGPGVVRRTVSGAQRRGVAGKHWPRCRPAHCVRSAGEEVVLSVQFWRAAHQTPAGRCAARLFVRRPVRATRAGPQLSLRWGWAVPGPVCRPGHGTGGGRCRPRLPPRSRDGEVGGAGPRLPPRSRDGRWAVPGPVCRPGHVTAIRTVGRSVWGRVRQDRARRLVRTCSVHDL